MTLRGEKAAQRPAGGIADAEFADQRRIAQSAPVEIVARLGIAIQLLLIEGGSLLQHRGEVRLRGDPRIQAGKALA